MMTKKDYVKAAEIVRECRMNAKRFASPGELRDALSEAQAIEYAFIRLFSGDKPRFDVERFRKACMGEGK